MVTKSSLCVIGNTPYSQPPKVGVMSVMGRQCVVLAHKHTEEDSVTKAHTCSSQSAFFISVKLIT